MKTNKTRIALFSLFGIFLGAFGVMGSAPLSSTSSIESITAPAVSLGNAYAAITDQTKNSIVAVLSEKVMKFRSDQIPFPFPFDDPLFKRFFGNPQGPGSSHGKGIPITGLGSGFIIDDKGHILTNNHVVQGMEKIHVALSDKQTFEAKVLGSDAMTDIAVLQLQGAFPKNLTSARLGDSDTTKPGYIVLAFGAPFGLTQTVTSGIISATGRSNVGIADFEDFIQTDAPINPGNSGGPLVNMRGEVIGINTAIATQIGQSAGVGFAIPINMAKEILPTLLKGKKVERGMLGIVVQDVTPSLKKQFKLKDTKGALVSQVNPGSPGEKAGIDAGDVIVKFAGKSVEDSRQLREQVAAHEPGKSEEITVLRNGKEKTVTAKLGQLKSEETEIASTAPTKEPLEKFGLEGKTLTPDLKSQLGVKEDKGIVITDIDATGPAAEAGLRPGDVITEVDRKKVDSLKQADDVLKKSKNPNEVLLLVKHEGESVYVTLETG